MTCERPVQIYEMKMVEIIGLLKIVTLEKIKSMSVFSIHYIAVCRPQVWVDTA